MTCLGRCIKLTATKQQQPKSKLRSEIYSLSNRESIYVPIKYNPTRLFFFFFGQFLFNCDLFLPTKNSLIPIFFFILFFLHFRPKIFGWQVRRYFFLPSSKLLLHQVLYNCPVSASGRCPLAVLEHVSFCSFIHCCICNTSVCHRARRLWRRLHALFLIHDYVSVTWHEGPIP